MHQYKKAEPFYERALKIREKALGPNNSAVVSSIGGLADLYRLEGDYAKAEPVGRRALELSEKLFGPTHEMTATAYNNLAATYHGMGKYDKAQVLYEKALKLLDDKLGPNHNKVGAALDNIGVLYREKGDYKKAESYALRAVEVTEKARGPDHPETATALNDLGKVYEAMGDTAKAQPLRERAATIRNKGKTKVASPDQTVSPQPTTSPQPTPSVSMQQPPYIFTIVSVLVAGALASESVAAEEPSQPGESRWIEIGPEKAVIARDSKSADGRNALAWTVDSAEPIDWSLLDKDPERFYEYEVKEIWVVNLADKKRSARWATEAMSVRAAIGR